jgi:phosphate transport system permease protein
MEITESLTIKKTKVSVKTASRGKRDIHFADKVFYYTLKVSAWGVVCLLLLMVGLLVEMSWPAFVEFGPNFFVNPEWNPWTGEYGALSFIYGTVVSSIIAVAIALPISVGVALFLNELAPIWLARPIGFFVEMLAAIPSIVYGMWGFSCWLPF